MKTSRLCFVFLTLFICLFPFGSAKAQEIAEDRQETLKARVSEVLSEKTEEIPGTSTDHVVQKLKIEILAGEKKGEKRLRKA
jgi:hypothetical protein